MNDLPRVRRLDEISVRLALVVAAIMLGSMAIAYNVEGWAARWVAADFRIVGDDSELLLDARPGEVLRDEHGFRYISESDWERMSVWRTRWVGLGLGLGGILTSLAVGWAVSRRVTRRVRNLALEVGHPIVEGQALPHPFEVGRADEIGVLAAALNDMRVRIHTLVNALRERDRERRDWIALVSHDLRNPLQALTACVDRATAEAQRIVDPAQRATMQRLLGTARLDVDRFEVLTQDLLDIARLDADDALVLEPVPPGEVARAAAAGMRVLAEAQGRALAVKIVGQCPVLDADGRRMLRALENLLRNAIQHARTRVELRVERQGEGAVRFSVDDDGAGLPVEADGEVDVTGLGTYKSRDDSSGLGLVVTRRVAETHGGRFGAYNRPAGGDGASSARLGATVWFEIPARLGDDPWSEEAEEEV